MPPAINLQPIPLPPYQLLDNDGCDDEEKDDDDGHNLVNVEDVHLDRGKEGLTLFHTLEWH